MVNQALNTFLAIAGLLLIFVCLSEGFQSSLKRLQAILEQRPGWKMFAYPVGALLVLGATALIVQTLVNFAALQFSYD
jgi:hypothetical protein